MWTTLWDKNGHIFTPWIAIIDQPFLYKFYWPRKEMNTIIRKLEITNSLIILDKSSKEKIEKSVRNIPNVKVTDVNHFSSYDIIKFKKVVFTESSVKELEKRYS